MNRRESFFALEIDIEFKAALYFYTILFFYLGFRLISGELHAEIIHILEMLAVTYAMGFAQVYLMDNFDEDEHVTARTAGLAVLCAAVYTALGFLMGWFERSVFYTALFFVYILAGYACTHWLYSFRRRVSTKELNRELEAYKLKKNAESQEEI